jgi:hypothetical protein
MTAAPPCQRYQPERLAELLDAEADAAASADLAAHLELCPDCRSARAAYRRLVGAFREVATDAQRRPDHVARLLAAAAAAGLPSPPGAVPATAPRRTDAPATHAPARPRWRAAARWAVPALGAAAAVALWWRWSTPRPAGFAIAVLSPQRQVLRGDARAGEAQVGERLRVSAPVGSAVWVYRNQHELVLQCPRDCLRRDGELRGELVLDSVGSYQIVWISSDHAAAPIGELERDITTARSAGYSHELRDLEVR